MFNNVVILIADDEIGHTRLIEKTLTRAGLNNPLARFEDGQQVLDFLFMNGPKPHRQADADYLLLLDIRMPKIDGVEVLRRIKNSKELNKIPVVMLTTTEERREVERCHQLGCNNYIVKPVDFAKLAAAIKKLGMSITLLPARPAECGMAKNSIQNFA